MKARTIRSILSVALVGATTKSIKVRRLRINAYTASNAGRKVEEVCGGRAYASEGDVVEIAISSTAVMDNVRTATLRK